MRQRIIEELSIICVVDSLETKVRFEHTLAEMFWTGVLVEVIAFIHRWRWTISTFFIIVMGATQHAFRIPKLVPTGTCPVTNFVIKQRVLRSKDLNWHVDSGTHRSASSAVHPT